MRFIFIIALLLGTTAIACKKERYRGSGKLQGTYTGTFSYKVDGVGATSNVTIHFAKDTLTGSSDMPGYPIFCKNSFSVSGNKVNFLSACFRIDPIGPDRTVMFEGEYELTFRSASSLRLVRTIDNDGRIKMELDLHK